MTNITDVSIDNHGVTYVLVLGWTRDLCTYFQQRGRCGRVEGQNAYCLLVTGITSFLLSTKQTLLPANSMGESDSQDDTLAGINSPITPIRRSTPNASRTNNKSKYDLPSNMKNGLVVRAIDELIDVLSLR